MIRVSVRLSILAALTAMASCSSNTSLDEQPTPHEDLGTPLRFSSPAVGTMESRTRASESLKSDFLVSTYKNYGSSTAQEEVMRQYEAKYKTDTWNTTNTSWNTVGTTTDGFYQEQFEKYWDTSAYPYEFLAIAPAPIENQAIKTGFSVIDGNVQITSTITGQTVADGTVTPKEASSPEYLLSQMERKRKDADATQTEDIDKLTNTTIGSNTSPTGKVPLPFHHLTSKVRFAIYTTEPVSESQSLPITDVSFKVKSSDGNGFVTSANGYSANVSSTVNALAGTFSGLQYSTDPVELLKLSGPTTEGTFPDAYLEKHEWKSKDDVNAYFFECKDGLAQVPQKNLQLLVSFTITPTVGEPYKVTDMPVELTDADGNKVKVFTWEPNHLYTYYIVVRHLFSHEISFTATVSDWEDINGKIATNLEE